MHSWTVSACQYIDISKRKAFNVEEKPAIIWRLENRESNVTMAKEFPSFGKIVKRYRTFLKASYGKKLVLVTNSE